VFALDIQRPTGTSGFVFADWRVFAIDLWSGLLKDRQKVKLNWVLYDNPKNVIKRSNSQAMLAAFITIAAMVETK
jgi:hypothetical protein